MYKYKELSSKKDIKKHLENPNDIISAKTTKIIFYCEGTMSKSIWTKRQEEYLDKRFGFLEIRMDKLETRMDKLETRMDKLKTRMDKLETRMDNLEKKVEIIYLNINKIIDILSRNGMT